MLVWLVLRLFGAGRFLEFFLRSASETVALGLSSAQWTSLALIAVATAGALVTTRWHVAALPHSCARASRRRSPSPASAFPVR
jgi:prolipoprotein diacylglyceryltransferase